MEMQVSSGDGLALAYCAKNTASVCEREGDASGVRKKPSRWRLDVQQPPWSTFVAGGFLPGGFASVQSRRWTAVWVKFWLRRMGNEYFAIDRE